MHSASTHEKHFKYLPGFSIWNTGSCSIDLSLVEGCPPHHSLIMSFLQWLSVGVQLKKQTSVCVCVCVWPHEACYRDVTLCNCGSWLSGFYKVVRASLVAQLLKNPPACGRPGFDPWVGKIPWRRERLPTPVFWPGEHQRSTEQAGSQGRWRQSWGEKN